MKFEMAVLYNLYECSTFFININYSNVSIVPEGEENMSFRKIFATETSLQIYDNRRIVLSRCRRIIEYNDIYLRVDAGSVIIDVWGCGLMVDDYGTEGIDVRGSISSVEFSDVPGKKKR